MARNRLKFTDYSHESKSDQRFKAFDIFEDEFGSVFMVTETNSNDTRCSAMCLVEHGISKTAWWDVSEVVIRTNLMILLAERMCHPFGDKKTGLEHISTEFDTIINK